MAQLATYSRRGSFGWQVKVKEGEVDALSCRYPDGPRHNVIPTACCRGHSTGDVTPILCCSLLVGEDVTLRVLYFWIITHHDYQLASYTTIIFLTS
jgi:hypothetical protein